VRDHSAINSVIKNFFLSNKFTWVCQDKLRPKRKPRGSGSRRKPGRKRQSAANAAISQ